MANFSTASKGLSEKDLKAKERYYIEWIVCDSIAVPFALLALYIIATHIAYIALKQRKPKAKMGSYRRKSSTVSSTGRSNTSVNEKHATAITGMCLFASIMALLRVAIDLRLVLGHHDNFGCDISIKFKVVAYGISIFTIYLVLWVRQRIFYADPRLKHLSSKFIRSVSWLMVFFLLISGLGAIVLFLIGAEDIGTPLGCRTVATNFSPEIRYAILIAFTVVFQVCFLGLFIYPLVKHYQSTRMPENAHDRDNPIIKLVKRATTIAILCMLTDVISVIIAIFIGSDGSASILLYDVNIVVNLSFLILSFPDWRMRLMPWRLTEEVEPEDREETITSASRNERYQSIQN